MNEQIDIQKGLSYKQVAQREEAGLVNTSTDLPTKTFGQIVQSHVFTLFNLLNFTLGGLVLFVGAYENALFLGIAIVNICIGVLGEWRAKRTIDRLAILSAPSACALRDGKLRTLPLDELVLDDILLLKTGAQVPADVTVVEGECEANEALLTGESDPVQKRLDDELLSGSFIVSGQVKARVRHIGEDNFTAKITKGAKQFKKPNSQILNAIQSIIKVIGVVIIPVGLLLYNRQYQAVQGDLKEVILGTVAALIGMIPEGLILLTSLVLAVGAIRLARHKTLVQELYCIETLARVDTLCLDKTGTITQGQMEVMDTLYLASKEVVDMALENFAAASRDENPTMLAVKARFGAGGNWKTEGHIPFSSARKFSAISFQNRGTYAIGAPEFLFDKAHKEELFQKVEAYSKEGYRVLVAAFSREYIVENSLPQSMAPIALLLLKDKIRKGAKETLQFFKEQGVQVKVISGDHPVTVSQIARETGVAGYENFVDASTLTKEELIKACETHTVFGRVSPTQKLEIVKALQAQGHIVAMTGDGVNDTLALREADCGIAMASGADAARTVSQLVLMDSNFTSLPKVVAEGRRIINNIQRSASLYLVKTIFSSLLAVFFAVVAFAYPFEPVQLTLISSLTIGIPSFLLALEPNGEKVTGRFLENVLLKALPGGLTVAILAIGTTLIGHLAHFKQDQISTMVTLLTAVSGFWVLQNVSRPLDWKRKTMFALLIAAFVAMATMAPHIFSLQDFTIPMLFVFAGEIALIQFLLTWLYGRLAKRAKKRAKNTVEKQGEDMVQ